MRWDNGDDVFFQIVGSVHGAACRGNREICKRIDLGYVVKQLAKFQTASAQNVHIGTAISHDFFLEVKHVIAVSHTIVPFHKHFSIARAHSVGIVIGCGGYRTDLSFIFFLIKEVREISFDKFFHTKRFWEIRKFHRDEIQRIDEFDVKHLDG